MPDFILDNKYSNLPKRPQKKFDLEIVFFTVLVFILIVLGFLGFFYTDDLLTILGIKKNNISNLDNYKNVSTSTVSYLPQDKKDEEDTGDDEKENSKTQAEKLFFENFYKLPVINFNPSAKNYSLPLNIKIDISNYFDINRKINLDKTIENFNSNGHSLIDYKSANKINNFFNAFNDLSKQKIPIFISSDFILYYYQNVLKEAYKDIEKNLFYETLWTTTKTLFEIADKRYQERLGIVGLENDYLLEGERKEAEFFAVALELLKPKITQISEEFISENKFNRFEATKYIFIAPAYLKQIVENEINLINIGKNIEKSPVLLYQKNYSEFQIPSNYKSNNKLTNFYLAMKWLNSVMPLNYKSSECEDCLLDKNDWQINTITASLIAKDFSQNQNLKNNWAKLYKTIAYFSGLRDDLTYIHYINSLEKLFGKDFNLSIFYNENKDENLNKLQASINEYKFNPLNGGYDRKNEKKYIGMRFLNEYFWPSNYIFKKLIYPDVTKYRGNKVLNFTSCENRVTKIVKCRASVQEIINLIKPISDEKFLDITNYNNYPSAVEQLKSEINKFDKSNWYGSNYWSYLNSLKSLYNIDYKNFPPFFKNNYWQDKKNNTILGGWVNLQLPADNLISKIESAYTNNFEFYLEPEYAFYNELYANVVMIRDMFLNLNVDNKKITIDKLNNLSSILENLINISIKELSNKDYSEKEIKIINQVINFDVGSNYNKSLKINFGNFDRLNQSTNENISGVNIMGVVYENKDNKKMIAVGPVFNYKESK